MTAQIPESLLYKGKQHRLITDYLLNVYFSQKGLELYFSPGNTALWRGFLGSWEVQADNKLFLIDLEGQTTAFDHFKYKEKRRELRAQHRAKEITPVELQKSLKLAKEDCFVEVVLTLEAVFHSNQPVFADWYTGPLVLQSGNQIKYVHLGYESVYEHTTRLKVVNGLVVSEQEVSKRNFPPF